MNNTDYKFKAASETISAFLSKFPKDVHTNVVLDYILKKILEENFCPSELDRRRKT